MFDRRGIHSRAGIRDGEQDIAAGIHIGVKPAIFLIELDIVSLNDESAAFRHSIPSIEAQIHQHLVNLNGVRYRNAKIRRGNDAHVDVFPNHFSKETRAFLDEAVEVDFSSLQDLLSREREELRCQPCRTLGLRADLLETVVEAATRLCFLTGKVRPAKDCADGVVEIVSYATG